MAKELRPRLVKPRTPGQKILLQTLNEYDFILLSGLFGTGKSYNVIGYACEQLLNEKYDKFVLCKSVSHLNDVLGFQKGNATEKVSTYFAQEEEYLIGFLGRQEYEKMLANKTIELLPAGLLRGRSFNNAIVYSTECQNNSKKECLNLLTRFSRGSKYIWDFDFEQIDIEYEQESCYLERLFSQIDDEEIGKVELTEEDCCRHKSLVRWYKKFKEIY